MLDNTQSIICAFGLAAAAPRSPYRHLELCGVAFRVFPRIAPAMRDFFCIFEKNREKLLDIGETVGYNNIAFSRAQRQMWRYSSVG